MKGVDTHFVEVGGIHFVRQNGDNLTAPVTLVNHQREGSATGQIAPAIAIGIHKTSGVEFLLRQFGIVFAIGIACYSS